MRPFQSNAIIHLISQSLCFKMEWLIVTIIAGARLRVPFFMFISCQVTISKKVRRWPQHDIQIIYTNLSVHVIVIIAPPDLYHSANNFVSYEPAFVRDTDELLCHSIKIMFSVQKYFLVVVKQSSLSIWFKYLRLNISARPGIAQYNKEIIAFKCLNGKKTKIILIMFKNALWGGSKVFFNLLWGTLLYDKQFIWFFHPLYIFTLLLETFRKLCFSQEYLIYCKL